MVPVATDGLEIERERERARESERERGERKMREREERGEGDLKVEYNSVNISEVKIITYTWTRGAQGT